VGNTEITDAILGAWEEEDEREGLSESEGTEPVGTTLDADAEDQDEVPSDTPDDDEEHDRTPDEEQEVVVALGEETEDEESDEEREEEEPSGDEEEPTALVTDDPETQAFLARHDGDTDAALRDGARLFRTVGRQGQELGALRAQVSQLEAQLEQATLFQQQTGYLSEEQQAWIEEAAGSG
jgi:hypothetical protein